MAIEHSEGMRKFHASRTPQQKAATSLKLSDAATCRMWAKKGGGNPNGRPGARKSMDPQTRIGTTTLAKLAKASIVKIMKDLAATDPELFREALIAGLQAPPPRSFPYLALAASYIDGRPPAEPPIQPLGDLSDLSRDELRDRVERLARLLGGDSTSTGLAVIDATVVPNPEDMTPEQLQEELRVAQLEVERANAELDRANEQLRKARGAK
jgi:hypothetical protein